LLGLVDTAVIGNLGDPALLGAIAIGGMIFSFLYWGFGFLRMGTTGLVAQAQGAGDNTEARAAFYRAILVGTIVGLLLLIVHSPIARLAFSIIEGSVPVETAALTYFQIRIWGAPFSLAHLAILGYLLGQQDTRAILIIQLVLNFTNIILDLVFVMVLGLGVEGVAAATVIAEVIAFLLGLTIVLRRMRLLGHGTLVTQHQLLNASALRRMFVVNRDIMIRTLCLIFAFAWFTNEGAKSGDVLLAANAILMQFVSFSAFFLDGFALTAESLVGNAVGAKNRAQLEKAIKYSSQLAFITAMGVSVLLIVFGPAAVQVLTNIAEVRDTANDYMIWAIAAPVLSIWCYLLDGIFIGATRTQEMRNAMVVSLASYLVAWWMLSSFGNHGLWASLMIYFVARALTLYYYLPRIRDSIQ
jgi:MATE family multidrug resistance protein